MTYFLVMTHESAEHQSTKHQKFRTSSEIREERNRLDALEYERVMELLNSQQNSEPNSGFNFMDLLQKLTKDYEDKQREVANSRYPQ
jgi:hypothetical protein